MRAKFFLLLFCIIFLSSISATLNVSLSDQGTDAKVKSTGAVINSGNLEVTIYDALTGGNLIYNETFTGVINNGTWNVMLGENSSNPLSLEFGKLYYKDYKINGQDLDFTNLTGGTVERKFFYSPLGDIGGEDINQNSNLTIANLSITNNISASSGLFSWLGSLTSRIAELFIQNISFIGNINGSGNITTTGRIGIGTEYPSNALDVRGQGNFSGTIFINNATDISVFNTTSNTLGLLQDMINGTELADTITLDANMNVLGYNFSINNSDLFVNVNTGNIGINTTSPTQRLHVIGNILSDNFNATGDITTTGVSAGYSNTGNYLTATGYYAGRENAGNNVVAIGYLAGYLNTRDSVTAIGYAAGQSNLGFALTATGRAAGFSNKGDYLTATGYYAGYSNKGNFSTTIGYQAGQSNTENYITAMGYQAGYSNTGIGLTATGYSAGNSNTGLGLTATGLSAGSSNKGNFSTLTGYSAGNSNTGLGLTAMGYYAGWSNKGNDSTLTGFYAGYQNKGNYSSGYGYEALRDNIANNVVAIGYQAGKDNAISNQFIVKQANVNAVPLIQGNFSSGFVGIGTNTPSQTLDVRGQGNFSGTIYINNATDVSTLGGGIPILLNNSYEVYFNQSYPTFINISNLLFVNKTLGNVGIGTTTPTEKLTVNGNVSLNNTLYVLGNGDVRIRTTGSANTNTFIVNGSMTIGKGVGGSLEEDNDAILGLSRSATAGYNMLIFQTGSSTTDSWAVGMLDGEADFVFDTSYGSGTGKRLVIQNATGNIGIGTTSPTEKLMVNGSFRVQNSSGTLALYVNDSTGNVGIGTTSPSSILHIKAAASSNSDDHIRLEGTQVPTASFFTIGNDAGRLFIRNNTAGVLFSIIHSSGNVGIGTTNPTAKLTLGSGRMLHTDTTDNFHIDSSASNRGTYINYYSGGNTILNGVGTGNVGIGSTDAGLRLEVEDTASTQVARFQDSDATCDAQPTGSGMTWSCASDEKLKTNITPSTFSALDYVNKIPLFDYTVKKTGEKTTGWVAQEMLKVHPELVSNQTDFNSLTNQTETLLAVSMIPQPIIIKSIQELYAENQMLKAELCLKDKTYSWCG